MSNKISIVIPAYNTASVISRTLQSIEKQTYPNYEIVLVNDGSTDGTEEFIDGYAHGKNNVVVYHQNNQGVSAARNKGIELATGNLVCFLDSDDTYEPTFLDKMLKRQQETNANVVHCGHNKVDKNHNVAKQNTHFNQYRGLSSFFSEDGYFHFSCILVKKSFLIEKNIKFDISKKSTEDVFFTVQLLIHSDIVCVKEYLFNYHYRSNSVTNSKWGEDNHLHDVESYSHIMEYVKNNYKNPDCKNVILFMLNHKTSQEMNYLTYCLIKFRYKSIKDYIRNKGLSDLYYILPLMRKSEKRKFSFVKKGNYFLMVLGTIYYRYIRTN